MKTDKINNINSEIDSMDSVVGEEELRPTMLENAKKTKVDKTREKEIVATEDLE